MVDSAASVQRRAAQTHPPCATQNGVLTLVSRMQALVLSMVDPAVLPAVEPGCGCAKEALAPLLAWFRGAMRELPPVEDAEDLDLVCIFLSYCFPYCVVNVHCCISFWLVNSLHSLVSCVCIVRLNVDSAYQLVLEIRTCTAAQQSIPPPAQGKLPAEGLPGAVERLHAAAAARAGTGEELAMLFVALLRALGLAVRSVRCRARRAFSCSVKVLFLLQ